MLGDHFVIKWISWLSSLAGLNRLWQKSLWDVSNGRREWQKRTTPGGHCFHCLPPVASLTVWRLLPYPPLVPPCPLHRASCGGGGLISPTDHISATLFIGLMLLRLSKDFKRRRKKNIYIAKNRKEKQRNTKKIHSMCRLTLYYVQCRFEKECLIYTFMK